MPTGMTLGKEAHKVDERLTRVYKYNNSDWNKWIQLFKLVDTYSDIIDENNSSKLSYVHLYAGFLDVCGA